MFLPRLQESSLHAATAPRDIPGGFPRHRALPSPIWPSGEQTLQSNTSRGEQLSETDDRSPSTVASAAIPCRANLLFPKPGGKPRAGSAGDPRTAVEVVDAR